MNVFEVVICFVDAIGSVDFISILDVAGSTNILLLLLKNDFDQQTCRTLYCTWSACCLDHCRYAVICIN